MPRLLLNDLKNSSKHLDTEIDQSRVTLVNENQAKDPSPQILLPGSNKPVQLKINVVMANQSGHSFSQGSINEIAMQSDNQSIHAFSQEVINQQSGQHDLCPSVSDKNSTVQFSQKFLEQDREVSIIVKDNVQL